MNINIQDLIIGFNMQENYEDIWLPHVVKTILKHLVQTGKQTKAARSFDEIYDIFDTKGIINANRLLYKKIFRPNIYMKAVLQYLADKGAGSAKSVRTLYRDEIGLKFEDARLYDAFNVLRDGDFITVEILPYTSPKLVQIFIAPFATTDQVYDSYRPYEADRIQWEYKQKTKQEIIKIEKTIKYEGKKQKVFVNTKQQPTEEEKISIPNPNNKYWCPNCEVRINENTYNDNNSECPSCGRLYEVIE